MKLVDIPAIGGHCPMFQLRDEDTGIVYPNILTAAQTISPSVREAACTYIQMKHADRLRASSAADKGLRDILSAVWSGTTTPSNDREMVVTVGHAKAILDKIERLEDENARLKERVGRQFQIIRAVQYACKGGDE